MKLTLHDCYALLRERIEVLDLLTSIRTVKFWEEMVELTTEGLQRAREQEVEDAKGVRKEPK